MKGLFDDFEEFKEQEPQITGDEKYSMKVQSPVYQPRVGGANSVYQCFDHAKYQRLMRRIESSNVSEEEKMFLRYAATRHIVFNYENVADYYAIASKEMQELMEDSALVIIDFNKALEKGFVVLNDKMRKLYDLELDR